MKRTLLALTALAFSLSASAAHADDFFNFSFNGYLDLSGQSLFSGSGVFDTQALGSGEYLVVGVTGKVNGVDINSILDPGAFPLGPGQAANDNILIFPPDGPLGGIFFDHDGVSFSLVNGADVNLNDTGLENAVESGGRRLNTELDLVSVTVDCDPPTTAATPEPSSLMMLGTGVLSATGLIRRRFVKA